MEIRTTTRKWGNSIAVIIPNAIVEEQGIAPDQDVVISLEKEKPLAREFFGLLKNKINKPTQQIKDEMRSGWQSESDRKTWQ